jgi:hypothetical protein
MPTLVMKLRAGDHLTKRVLSAATKRRYGFFFFCGEKKNLDDEFVSVMNHCMLRLQSHLLECELFTTKFIVDDCRDVSCAKEEDESCPKEKDIRNREYIFSILTQLQQKNGQPVLLLSPTAVGGKICFTIMYYTTHNCQSTAANRSEKEWTRITSHAWKELLVFGETFTQDTVVQYGCGTGTAQRTKSVSMKELTQTIPVVVNDLTTFQSKDNTIYSTERIKDAKPSASLRRQRPPPVDISEVRASPHMYIRTEIEMETILETPMNKRRMNDYQRLLKDPRQVAIRMDSLDALRRMYEALKTVSRSQPYRTNWDDVFTSRCDVNPTEPCGSCTGCRRRMCQAAMVVFAAQGCMDMSILGHLGAVLRLPRYSSMSIEEWSLLSLAELSMIFKPCSKHCLNAHHFHYFVIEIFANGAPTTLLDVVCFRGIWKKTGCLYLLAVYNLDYGIVADSHVKKRSISLGWVTDPQASATVVSYMLEEWAPSNSWRDLNIHIAGSCQMTRVTSQVRTSSDELGLSTSMPGIIEQTSKYLIDRGDIAANEVLLKFAKSKMTRIQSPTQTRAKKRQKLKEAPSLTLS